MAQQTINVGNAPNDGQGDPLRTAFTKTNTNFTDLYTNGAVPPALTAQVATNTANIITATNTANAASTAAGTATTAANAATAATLALQPVQTNLTLGMLRQAFPASLVTGAPIMNTIDVGFAQFSKQTGTWYPMHPFVADQTAIPQLLPPSGSVLNNGVYVVGQNPAASATLSFSATSGAGVTATFSAATLLGTSLDINRIITINDTGGFRYALITAQSSTTVCTVTISGGTLSTTGAFSNAAVFLTASPAGTAGYSCPITRVFQDCFIYCKTGVLFTSSQCGWYYAQWAVGPTVGSNVNCTVFTIFNNFYGGAGHLVIPASPTAFASTGPGAFTQLTTGTNAVQFAQALVPGNSLNKTGMLEYRFTVTTPATTTNKQVNTIFGGTNFAGDTVSNVPYLEYYRAITNSGRTNRQTIFSSSTRGSPGAGTNITNQAVDTTVGRNAGVACYLVTNDTDWLAVEQFSYLVTPSSVLDDQVTPSIFIPTPSIIPPGAAAIGISSNTWLVNPVLSDVSFNLTDQTHKLYAGEWYNSNPPYSSSGGYLQNATINGASCLQINQLGDSVNPGVATQNQSSQSGTLRTASSSVPFYFEVNKIVLTPNGYNTDNFGSVFMNPQQHNAANGSTYPYGELDMTEMFVFALDSNNPYPDDCNSFVRWPSGSGGASSTRNNSNAVNAGASLNRNNFNVHGLGLDPVGKTLSWWLNGNLNFQLDITAEIAAGYMLAKNYYLIFGASSRSRAVNSANAYSHAFNYISLWGG